MLSYFLYLSPLLILVIAGLCIKEIKLFGIISAALLIILILVLRDNVGFDYHEYVQIYYNDRPTSEPIYKLLHSVILTFDDHLVYFAVYGLIATIPVVLVSLERLNIWILLIYITLPQFYIDSFSTIRQACALSLCIYAYHLYDLNKKYWLVLLILAMGFHYSAIAFSIGLIVVNFSSESFKKIILVILILLAFLHKEILDLIINYYPKLSYYAGQNNYGVKQIIFNLLLIAISYRFLNSRDSKMILAVGIIITVPLMSVDAVFLRLVSYFLIPILFVNARFSRRLDGVFTLAMLFILFFGFFSVLYLKSLVSTGSMIPYESIL